jgi:hypothetical protein
MKRSSSCRLRKVACPDCGYTIRMARSWMNQGLPVCPCGQSLRPDSPADLAWCGLIGREDMPAPMWTIICRENGWDDAIERRGGAARAFQRKVEASGGVMGRKAGAAHCAYSGCGLWVSDTADRCSAGHAQHDHAVELEAMPF